MQVSKTQNPADLPDSDDSVVTQPLHRMTPEERRAFGAARRKQLRRQAHAQWFAEDRRSDPMALLEESSRGRVPELVKLKYQLMAQSPFTFFRGAVPVMAADLATLPNTGLVNQICGDAHVRNLGAYAAPDGRLVFDINDFDETTRAPFEWDLKRLAASLVLAGRESGSRRSDCNTAVAALVVAYAQQMECFAGMTVIDAARCQIHGAKADAPIAKVLLKAQRSTPMHTLESLTIPVSPANKATPTPRVFKEQKPMLTKVSADQARMVLASLKPYRETLLPERRHFLDQYTPIDVAFKVVGTGSVGLRDYVVYLEGNGPGDPLFLQIKEEAASGWAPYVDHPGEAAHQGQRVAEGQRAMQFASDIFLGWTTIADREYLVRQLNDHKASIEVTDLAGPGLAEYATMCGKLLARGHSRSGDACVLAGYIGGGRALAEALVDFAHSYAAQTEKDWQTLLDSGLVPKSPAGATPPPKGKPKNQHR
jgi:uncharacterized protein (DUF2252 family)